MILFCEDVALEEIAKRLLRELNPTVQIHSVMQKRGSSYLQKSIPKIIRSSQALRFLVMLDGDVVEGRCIGEVITEWFQAEKPHNITVRFANLEAENWLLADKQGMAEYLRISPDRIPLIRDDYANAKEFLVRLAMRSPSRELRNDMVPKTDHSSVVGPAYNFRLREFINDFWNIERARENNSSLERACNEITSLSAF
jgi:hypothetical protein